MNPSKKTSSFQSVILELIREELNMMLCETFQLKEKVNFSDYEKLTSIVLKEIASAHILSPHLTPEKARKYMKLLNNMDCHTEISKRIKVYESLEAVAYDSNDSVNGYCEDSNPYSDSPLF